MAETRIVIAADNERVTQALQDQLHSLGYTVEGVASTSGDAVRLCEQLRPALLIMDMQMPDRADDVARHIRTRIGTPIVILIDFSDADSARRAEDAGALAYVVKPVNPEELPPAIDIALARHRDLQQLREHVDDLHEALESRKLIERAKGILMKRLHISDAEAEARLRQRAQEKKSRIKDIAQTIVDSDALLS